MSETYKYPKHTPSVDDVMTPQPDRTAVSCEHRSHGRFPFADSTKCNTMGTHQSSSDRQDNDDDDASTKTSTASIVLCWMYWIAWVSGTITEVIVRCVKFDNFAAAKEIVIIIMPTCLLFTWNRYSKTGPRASTPYLTAIFALGTIGLSVYCVLYQCTFVLGLQYNLFSIPSQNIQVTLIAPLTEEIYKCLIVLAVTFFKRTLSVKDVIIGGICSGLGTCFSQSQWRHCVRSYD